jgi:hypothetical protein
MPRYDKLWKCVNPEIPGLFSRLATRGVPWSEDIPAAVLDDTYMRTYSGGKPPSPVIRRWAEGNEGYLTAAQMEKLADMLVSINGTDWLRSWGAEEEDYNPISNYDMREVMTDDIHERDESVSGSTTYGRTDTRTDNLSDGYGSTTTRTDNLQTARTGTETTQGSSDTDTSSESSHKVYGLNSSTAVPSDEDTSVSQVQEEASQTLTRNTTDSHTGTLATARTGSDTHTGTQAHVQGGSDTDTRTTSMTDSHSYTLTRTGNIGTMTTQDMLTQERTLRAWRLFYDRVFPDLDRLLTLCTY